MATAHPLSASKERRGQRRRPRTHTCAHTHTHMHTYTHMHTCTHTYAHMHTHTHTCTHTHAHVHTHTNTHAHAHMHTHMHTCTHICTHAHTHAHVHTRTRARTHMHTCTHTCTHPPTRTHIHTCAHTHTCTFSCGLVLCFEMGTCYAVPGWPATLDPPTSASQVCPTTLPHLLSSTALSSPPLDLGCTASQAFRLGLNKITPQVFLGLYLQTVDCGSAWLKNQVSLFS
jgi:hypothetical protein